MRTGVPGVGVRGTGRGSPAGTGRPAAAVPDHHGALRHVPDDARRPERAAAGGGGLGMALQFLSGAASARPRLGSAV